MKNAAMIRFLPLVIALLLFGSRADAESKAVKSTRIQLRGVLGKDYPEHGDMPWIAQFITEEAALLTKVEGSFGDSDKRLHLIVIDLTIPGGKLLASKSFVSKTEFPDAVAAQSTEIMVNLGDRILKLDLRLEEVHSASVAAVCGLEDHWPGGSPVNTRMFRADDKRTVIFAEKNVDVGTPIPRGVDPHECWFNNTDLTSAGRLDDKLGVRLQAHGDMLLVHSYHDHLVGLSHTPDLPLECSSDKGKRFQARKAFLLSQAEGTAILCGRQINVRSQQESRVIKLRSADDQAEIVADATAAPILAVDQPEIHNAGIRSVKHKYSVVNYQTGSVVKLAEFEQYIPPEGLHQVPLVFSPRASRAIYVDGSALTVITVPGTAVK